jgi:hypothetical protein
MMRWLGETPTGRIVNLVRLFLGALGLVTIAVAISTAASVLRMTAPTVPWQLWGAVGLFFGGMVLVMLSASYKIRSNPFLLEFVLDEAHKSNASPDDIAKLIKTLEAHAGVAGVFNRLDFTGASLGTVVAAILVLVLGLIAVRLQVVADYNVFPDIAKLLFGAFVGSYAARSTAASASTWCAEP